MPKFFQRLISFLLGLTISFISLGPVNVASSPNVKAAEKSIFPELETCTNCRIEENKRVGLTGTVLTVQATMLYLIPIQDDFSVDPFASSLKVPIHPGMSFEIAHTYQLVDGFSRASSYGLLANTYGGKYLGVLLLSSNSVMNTIDYVKKNVRIGPVVTYIAGANDLYPNKVENILLALEHLSAYQNLHQGFKADKYISTLRAFGFYSYDTFQAYKLGAMASGVTAPAGGVCAVATGLASLAYLTEGAKIIDIVHHDSDHLYFQGPYGPTAKEVDSGISIRPDGSFEELGFTMPKAGFFRVDVQLLPSGVVYNETDPKGLRGLSDALLLFSISYSPKPLPEQANNIAFQLAAFQQFRTSAHTIPLFQDDNSDPEIVQNPENVLTNIQIISTAQD